MEPAASTEAKKPKTVTPKRRAKSKSKRRSVKSPPVIWPETFVAWGIEISGWLVITALAMMVLAGYCASRFTGISVMAHVLPFAAFMAGGTVVIGLVLWAWWKLRRRLAMWSMWIPPVIVSGLTATSIWLSTQEAIAQQIDQFRTLVGGRAEAERRTLAHQVYATYRRADLGQTAKMLARAGPFLPEIDAAAHEFSVDKDILVGVAAAESSFIPRDSKDGGRGLFQITSIPKTAQSEARAAIDATELDLNNPGHNAMAAAATLRFYLRLMQGDLFLGLLAYNIGPTNGGLVSIMRQYGARDFVTIQPYLQNLPRDYPIRVLSFALAYRLWRRLGALPHYEEGANALNIQKIGVPGLNDG